jgi:hypothetical protein
MMRAKVMGMKQKNMSTFNFGWKLFFLKFSVFCLQNVKSPFSYWNSLYLLHEVHFYYIFTLSLSILITHLNGQTHLIFKVDSHMVHRNVYQPHISLLLFTKSTYPHCCFDIVCIKKCIGLNEQLFLFVNKKFGKLMSEFVYDIQYKCPKYE